MGGEEREKISAKLSKEIVEIILMRLVDFGPFETKFGSRSGTDFH